MTTGRVYSTRIALTNRLDALMGAVSNELEISSCKLLKACLLLDCAEEELWNPAYNEATNLCMDVEQALSDRQEAWQLHGAHFIMMSACSFDGKHTNAIFIATNALKHLDEAYSLNIETNVWGALSTTDAFGTISLRDAFRTGAALNLARVHDTTDISTYTNGLQSGIVKVIEELMNSNNVP